MFSFRSLNAKKFLSVILSSCTLGCLSSFLVCQSVNNLVTKIDPLNPSTAAVTPTPGTDSEMEVTTLALDGFTIKGNQIVCGGDKSLLQYDCIPPQNCDLYVRAVKIQDKYGTTMTPDLNTSDYTNDTKWIKYEGVSTFDWLKNSSGIYKLYAVRYSPNGRDEYEVDKVILDTSMSKDGINRYLLINSAQAVIKPDVSS